MGAAQDEEEVPEKMGDMEEAPGGGRGGQPDLADIIQAAVGN